MYMKWKKEYAKKAPPRLMRDVRENGRKGDCAAKKRHSPVIRKNRP